MTTYTPTDEQIEAIARHSYLIGDEWDSAIPANRTLALRAARRDAESPAFQAIIRAAREEARSEALRESASVVRAYSNWKADVAFHVASILDERAEATK